MENSLHEIKEIQWDWDEDDNGDVAEFVVIDGEKYVDVSYFNQKLEENEDRFELHKNTDAKTIQDQSDLIEELKAKLAVNKKWLASNEGFLENQKLKQQLTLTEKALELACQTIKRMCPPLWIGGNVPPPEVKDAEYFIEKAEEEMKSE